MNELENIDELQKNEKLQHALLEVDQIVFKGGGFNSEVQRS